MSTVKIILAIITFGLFTTLFIFMCSDGDGHDSVETEVETIKKVSYEVISEKGVEEYSKAEIEIRLSDKIDESSIRQIAEKFQKKYIPKYRRAFIWFYVGDNKNCFATAHCEPDMRIEILQPQGIGVSAMAEKAKQVDGELIYCFYEDDVTGCMYAIYTKGEQHFIKNVYPDGQTSIEEMIRKDLDDRIKFTYKTTGSYGDEYYEFYMGDLNLCNKEGKVFATARKYEK